MKLVNNRGFKWLCQKNVYIKGYFYKDRNILNTNQIIMSLSKLESYEDFREFVKSLNGCFSIVVIKDKEVYAAVDIARSFPLYYCKDTRQISDSVQELLSNNKIKIHDELAIAELMASGFIQGNRTTFKNIGQILAGQTLKISQGMISTDFYFKHTHKNLKYSSDHEVIRKLDKVSNDVFKTLIESLNGKTAIIPLSGGYDSRFIAAMLKKNGYENVICYTYGQKDSYEVKISKEVAKTLNYPWFFVEYHENLWKQILSEKGMEYANFMHNFSSIPHYQDFPALKSLKDNKILPEDGIIINGFCGDLPAGSFVLSEVDEKNIKYDFDWLAEFIYIQHYQFLTLPNELRLEIIKKIKKFLVEMDMKLVDFEDFTSLYEAWFTNSRPIQWVVNSNRVYEFFGLEWRMPLWDVDFIKFFYSLEVKYRRDSKIYNEFLFSEIFNRNGLNIKKPELTKAKSLSYRNSLKAKVRKKIYRALVFISFYTGWTSWNYFDVNNYSKATLMLYKKLKLKKIFDYKSINFHQMNALWWNENLYGSEKIRKIMKL